MQNDSSNRCLSRADDTTTMKIAIFMCKSISEERAGSLSDMLEEFIYFLLKNPIKHKQKSDWNKYEIAYENVFYAQHLC